jgi:LysM repeat protein
VAIAARFDIPTNTLMQANGMTAATAANLQVGRVLVIPGIASPQNEETQTYIVRAGDTMVGIALRFNVDTASLLRVNGFSEQQARTIQVGQVIVIPVSNSTGTSGQVQPVATPATQATPTRTPTRSPTPVSSAQSASSAPLTTTGGTQSDANGVLISAYEPGDNSRVQSKVAFRWTGLTPLPEGMLYELVFWRTGEDPLVNGFGMAAPTDQNYVLLDLDLLNLTPGFPLDFGQYRWGVLIVRTQPSYSRLSYAGGGFLITYETSGGAACPPDDASCRGR